MPLIPLFVQDSSVSTVTLSVGRSNATDPNNMDGVSGTGTPWVGTVTFASLISSAIEVGDVMTDDAANDYVVTAIASLQSITVQAEAGQGVAPDFASETAGFERAYTNYTAAAAGPSTWIVAGNTLRWEGHKEGTMPLTEAPVMVDDTTLGATGTLEVTVADEEWHRGIPGVGFIAKPNADGSMFNFVITSASCPTQIIERLEITGRTIGAESKGIIIEEDGTNQTTIRDCIVHDFITPSFALFGIYINSGATSAVKIENCLVYDLTRSGGSGQIRGYRTDTTNAEFDYCNAYNCRNGFYTSVGGSNNIAKNCASLGNPEVGDYVGTGWDSTCTNNASSDTTAPDGSGANTSYESLTLADEWKDAAGGDFHLRNNSTLYKAGVVIAGLTHDIGGKSRLGIPDVGAYEYREPNPIPDSRYVNSDMYIGGL